MKNLKLCLIVLMLLTIASCKTIEYIEVPIEIKPEVEDPPEREELLPRDKDVELSNHLFNRMTYYSELVEEWESWAVGVYESLDLELPESLQSIKNETEVPE